MTRIDRIVFASAFEWSELPCSGLFQRPYCSAAGRTQAHSGHYPEFSYVAVSARSTADGGMGEGTALRTPNSIKWPSRSCRMLRALMR